MGPADVATAISWPGAKVKIDAFYRVVDPAAVKLVFHLAGHQPSAWIVSRDTLREALVYSNGLCDFIAGPEDSENVKLVLYPARPDPEKRTFLVRRLSLAWFIKQTELLVPEGTENYDTQIDAFIANTLGAVQ